MKFRKVEKRILKDGWYQVKQKGSHYQYKHPTKLGKATRYEHGGDLNPDMVKSILKQASILSLNTTNHTKCLEAIN